MEQTKEKQQTCPYCGDTFPKVASGYCCNCEDIYWVKENGVWVKYIRHDYTKHE
jgi:hypothetical protein